jgi:hypothetical protein
MRVCPRRSPVDVTLGPPTDGHRARCWLHGPYDELDDTDRQPLPREEHAIADEA